MKIADVLRKTDEPNELITFPDPKVISAGLGARSVKVKVAGHVRAVKTGTPLRKWSDGSWVPSDDEHAELIAATFGHGGQEVHAYRALNLDIYRNPRENGLPGFYAGDRVRVASLDEYGRPTFESDRFGRWFAINETTVTMDCSRAFVKKRPVDANLKAGIAEDEEPPGVDLP